MTANQFSAKFDATCQFGEDPHLILSDVFAGLTEDEITDDAMAVILRRSVIAVQKAQEVSVSN